MSTITDNIPLLPTKCLQAIVAAEDKYGKLGHTWANCIFARATHVVAGETVNCDSSVTANVFQFSPIEKSAMTAIIREWDNLTITQSTLMLIVRDELSRRHDKVALEDLIGSEVTRARVISGIRGAFDNNFVKNNYLNSILENVEDEFKLPAGEVVTVKRPEKFDFNDAMIYAWLESFNQELVDA